jgi:uncharacterized protein DUF2278
MPLNDGYGVVIGTLDSFNREDPDSYGNYYHGILKLSTPDGLYTCAIDVDTPNESVGVEYKIIDLSSENLGPVVELDNDYHELTATQNSGAVDYVRSPHLVPRLPERIRKRLMFFFMGHLVRWIENIMLRKGYGWIGSTGDNTLNAL